MSMMKSRSRVSRSESIPHKSLIKAYEMLGKGELSRTNGAEGELLVDDHERKIFIWDLAGRSVFRNVQDLIFPKISQSFLFVFVFNPFEGNTQRLKSSMYEAFRGELEEWLRFLASNCQITAHPPPALVILTHEDCLRKDMNVNVSTLKNMLLEVQEEFHGLVDLLHTDLFLVDATSRKKVEPITTRMLELMENELTNLGIPVLCSQLISDLSHHVKSTRADPVWSATTFHEFVRKSQTLCASSEKLNAELLQAITMFLHDLGSVFVVERENQSDDPWIVVDVNWLTENFLGRLICLRHNAGNVEITVDGVMGERKLKELMSIVSELDLNKRKQVNGSLLEDLILGLGLCYKNQGDERANFFIPVLADYSNPRTNKLVWEHEHEEGCYYLGYRLKCHDVKRTKLSPLFFPKFQIWLRQRLMKNLGIEHGCIECQIGLMKIKYGAYEIFLEVDHAAHEHIDILMKSSSGSETDLSRFLHDRAGIVQELISFCASPKGCPGITLVKGVLRTESVRYLVSMQERKEPQHCVMVQVVKEKLQESISYQLERIHDEYDEETLLTLHYAWPGSVGETEQVGKILDEGDMRTIVASLRTNAYESEIHRSLLQIRQIDKSLSSFASTLELETDDKTRTSTVQNRDFQLSEEGQYLANMINHGFTLLGSKVEAVGINVDRLPSDIRVELQQLKSDIRSEFQEMQSTMSKVNSTIDRILGYNRSKEEHSTPRRPYLTRPDARKSDKVKSVVMTGTAVCLHFMCEARDQPHFVPNQPGFSLLVSHKTLDWVSTISKLSLQMVTIMLNAGISITTGFLGNVVPDLFSFDTGKTVRVSEEHIRELELASHAAHLDPKDPSIQQAWASLHRYLASELHGQYGSLFLLHQVRYNDDTDPYAWLCHSCLEKGLESKVLSPL